MRSRFRDLVSKYKMGVGTEKKTPDMTSGVHRNIHRHAHPLIYVHTCKYPPTHTFNLDVDGHKRRRCIWHKGYKKIGLSCEGRGKSHQLDTGNRCRAWRTCCGEVAEGHHCQRKENRLEFIEDIHVRLLKPPLRG